MNRLPDRIRLEEGRKADRMEPRERRASIARTTIDKQTTYREHLHREIAAITDEGAAYRRVLSEEHARISNEWREAVQKHAEAKRDLDSARQTTAATGKYCDQARWQRLNNNVVHWSGQVAKLQGALGALRDQMRDRAARRLPDWFMDAAKIMLEPQQYDAILDVAVNKSRAAKITANGGKP